MKFSFLILTVSFFLHSSLSLAGLDLLSAGEIRALIGDFPAAGSAALALDDSTLLSLQKSRTEKECAFAASQSNLNVERVFVKPVGPLEKDEFQDATLTLLKLQAKVGVNVFHAKEMYRRPRPYQRNPLIKPCIPLENSSSYPSGHTAVGRAVGKYLADRFPDRAEDIMKVADQVGANRILGGVHHPSDVEAGRKLGDELALRTILDRD